MGPKYASSPADLMRAAGMEPTSSQLQWFADVDSPGIIAQGRGAGATTAAIFLALSAALNTPGARVIVASPHPVVPWMALLGAIRAIPGLSDGTKTTRHTRTVRFPGEATIHVTLAAPEKIAGADPDLIVVDDARKATAGFLEQAMLLSKRSSRGGGCRLLVIDEHSA